MELLFEIAGYSLHQLSKVPEEISCTRRHGKRRVPGEKCTSKSPVMQAAVKKIPIKREYQVLFMTLQKHELFQ